MYGVGRPVTMTEISHRLPNMPEWDLLVTSPKLIALPRLTANKRAQMWVINMSSMIIMVHHTTEQQLITSLTHKWHTATNDVMLCEVPMTRTPCTTPDPHYVCPPDEVLEEQIPPKPLYYMGPNTGLLWMERDSKGKPKAMLGLTKEWSLPLYGPTLKSLQLVNGKQKPQTNFQKNVGHLLTCSKVGQFIWCHSNQQSKDQLSSNEQLLLNKKTLANDGASTIQLDRKPIATQADTGLCLVDRGMAVDLCLARASS